MNVLKKPRKYFKYRLGFIILKHKILVQNNYEYDKIKTIENRKFSERSGL